MEIVPHNLIICIMINSIIFRDKKLGITYRKSLSKYQFDALLKFSKYNWITFNSKSAIVYSYMHFFMLINYVIILDDGYSFDY